MDILIFILIILVPGYLLLRLLFNKLDVFLVLPIAFVLGLLLLTLSALPSYIFFLNFLSSITIITAYTLALLLLVLRKKSLFLKLEFKFDFITLTLLILTIGAALMMFWVDPHFDGDALFHLGQIRKLAENAPVSPTEAFFPIDKVNPAYGYNIWYFAVALTAALSKIDVTTVWSHLIFLLVPISILSLFTFALGVFKHRLVALTAAILYVFFLGYLANAWEFRLAPYPDQIARHVVLFVSLYFFFQFVLFRSKLYFFLAVFTAVLMATIHSFSWLHFLIAVGSFGVAGLLLLPSNYFKNCLKIISATLLISAPLLFLKLQNVGTVIGRSGLKGDALVLTDDLFMIDPLAKGSIFIISSFILAYLVFKYRKSLKRQIWLIFVASSALAGFFIMFNPLIAPVAAKLVSYTYMHRLGSLLYKELIFAAFIVYVVLTVRGRLRFDINVKLLLIAIAIFTILLTPPNYIKDKVENLSEEDAKSLVGYIGANLPEKSVFAADMWTSYRIGAFTNNYIVATFPQHMTPNVDKVRRIEDLKSIFSSKTSLGTATNILDKYKVSYAIVNPIINKYDILVDQTKFEDNKEFSEIYHNDIYRLYLYNPNKEKVE